jgi:multicomponent Na+:H+ antiporter subunit B
MSNVMMRVLKAIPEVLVLGLLASVLFVGILFDQPPVDTAKTYCFEHGSAETGAINLVTAIYLEYRAFDTLGETIVLLLSIAGVVFLLEHQHA